MKSKILHILQDEKVVDSFISMMEEKYPSDSHYLVIMKGDQPKTVKSRMNVIFFQVSSTSLKKFIENDIGHYKHICLHSIGGECFYQYIKHKSISWVIWGADLYESLLTFKGYKLYENNREQLRVRAAGKPVIIYWLLTYIRDMIYFWRQSSLLNKINYIITDNECDYNVFKRFYPKTRIRHLGSINYYPIENLVGTENLGKWCIGDSIWVGNSPAPNGNHIGIFRKLATFSCNKRIYSPLSYGDKRFIKYINNKGKQLLGEAFNPLLKFLSPQEYYSMFLDVNAFIYGHYRQCGVGNILMALYFGGKVFLYNKNPLLKMYKDMSFHIFSIDDDLNEEFAMRPLSHEERVHNRELVISIASKEQSLNQIESVFKNIIGSSN